MYCTTIFESKNENLLKFCFNSILKIRSEEKLSKIEFHTDALTEPMFYFLNTLDNNYYLQVINGYLKRRINILEVYSDSAGIIYIPRVGYFKTEIKNSQVRLNLRKKICFFKNKEYKVIFSPIKYVRNTLIEIYSLDLQLLKNRINEINPEFSKKIQFHILNKNEFNRIHNAIDSIRKKSEFIFNIIANNTKGIYIFESKYFHSFTNLSLNGILFINKSLLLDNIDIQEQLIHESAHCLLNYAFYNDENWFKENPYILKYKSSFKKEKRGLIHCIHACFVTYVLLIYFDEVITIESKDYYNLLGRLLYYENLFKIGLSNIKNEELYNYKGVELINEMIFFQKLISDKYEKEKRRYKVRYDEGEFEFNNFILDNGITLNTKLY
jgi:hypothetical protein